MEMEEIFARMALVPGARELPRPRDERMWYCETPNGSLAFGWVAGRWRSTISGGGNFPETEEWQDPLELLAEVEDWLRWSTRN